MSSTRTDLSKLGHNSSYLFLTIIFTFLSVVGILMFFQIINLDSGDYTANTLTPIENDTPLPTVTDDTTNFEITPTLSSISPIVSPTPLPEISTPTPQAKSYSSVEDKFSATYSSDRKVYQDNEGSGRRYTFYRSTGNIALHVGSEWSWQHPGRTFSSDFTIDSQNTFRYEIANQTIVDIEANDLKYTIQCLHSGTDGQKTECEEFMKSFKLTP